MKFWSTGSEKSTSWSLNQEESDITEVTECAPEPQFEPIDGETVETVRDYIFGSTIMQMVTAAIKWKDICSLEEKLRPT